MLMSCQYRTGKISSNIFKAVREGKEEGGMSSTPLQASDTDFSGLLFAHPSGKRSW